MLLNKRMSLPSVLEIIVVSAALIVAVLREYRFLALTSQQKSSVALRAFRIMGFLFVGFGVLGQILAAAGYGGTGQPIEVHRWHPVLGNLGEGYEEGPTILGEWSTLGMITGLGVAMICALVLWKVEQQKHSSTRASDQQAR
jgi:hypothetical protein